MVKKKTLPFFPRSYRFLQNLSEFRNVVATQMTSIFAGFSPPQNKAEIPIKTREKSSKGSRYILPTYLGTFIQKSPHPERWYLFSIVFLGFGTYSDFHFLPPHPASQIRSAQLPRSTERCPGRRHDPTSSRKETLERRCVKGLSQKIQCEGFNDVSGLGRLSIIGWLAR